MIVELSEVEMREAVAIAMSGLTGRQGELYSGGGVIGERKGKRKNVV